MPSKNLSALRPSARARAVVGTLMVVVVLLIAGFSYLIGQMASGSEVWAPDKPDTVMEATKVTLGTLEGLTKLILASFGAVAFLLGYQRESRSNVSEFAWIMLSAGLVLLTGALLFCLLCINSILTMIGNGGVSLGLDALEYARGAIYVCLVSAAGCFATFATSLAKPVPAST